MKGERFSPEMTHGERTLVDRIALEQDLERLKDIQAWLREQAEKDAATRTMLPTTADVVSEHTYKEAVEFLSRQPWEHVFTTANPDGDGDSIYFVTKSGASIRLKTSELKTGGLEGVVQPTVDLLLFVDRNGSTKLTSKEVDGLRKTYGSELVDLFPAAALSSKPVVGYGVEEYALRPDLANVENHVRLERHGENVLILYPEPSDIGKHSGHEIKEIRK